MKIPSRSVAAHQLFLLGLVRDFIFSKPVDAGNQRQSEVPALALFRTLLYLSALVELLSS